MEMIAAISTNYLVSPLCLVSCMLRQRKLQANWPHVTPRVFALSTMTLTSGGQLS
jgi:hypothetical protein